MDWSKQNVLVTGGASFIGSHLVDALADPGASVRVVDNLSSRKIENIQRHIDSGRLEFFHEDLLEPGIAQQVVEGMNIVFHLAVDHGTRGYVDLHQAACATNSGLYSILFMACRNAQVDKVVYASSGCLYPNHLQNNPDEELYLIEDMVGSGYDADNMCGWTKLVNEMTLKAYYKDYGMRSVCCRYFTVYGERSVENHAVIAMIVHAFVEENPFIVWGTGKQVRNWTYVSDIVEGTILAAEKINDGTAINLGTMERTRVIDTVHEVLQHTGHQAEIEFSPKMSTGPYNRVVDNSLARKLLGWEPQISFMDGLHGTIDWYFANKDRERVKAILERMLTER